MGTSASSTSMTPDSPHSPHSPHSVANGTATGAGALALPSALTGSGHLAATNRNQQDQTGSHFVIPLSSVVSVTASHQIGPGSNLT